MKVILLEDVYKQGVAGEMVEVAPGYARNYLIPRRLAVKATAGTLRQFENLSKQAEVRRQQQQERNSELATRIEGLSLAFPVKAGEAGKLYGSVTPADIAQQIEDMLGIQLERRRIGDKPLRELGTFNVPIRLDGGVVSHVQVIVHREGEAPVATEPVTEDQVAPEAEVYYEDMTDAGFADAETEAEEA